MFRWLAWLWHWFPGLGLRVTLIIIVGIAFVVALVAGEAIYWPGLFFTTLFEPSYPQGKVSLLGLAASVALWVDIGYLLHNQV